MKLLKATLFLALALNASASLAVEPWTPTDAEMASLPPFCKARFNEGSPEYKLWESMLGKDFGHTHHYCAGVNFLNRYYRARSAQAKRFNLNSARATLDYMVTHAAPTYSLMPDVYLSLGTVYMLSNQSGQAIASFNQAIELNPRLPKAYGAIADFYLKAKQPAKALEIVTEGLRHNPDTKSLQSRYRELGGKLPYPPPIVPAAKPAEETAPPVQASAEPSAETPAPATAAPASPPKIGSPQNPYCRFCPD